MDSVCRNEECISGGKGEEVHAQQRDERAGVRGTILGLETGGEGVDLFKGVGNRGGGRGEGGEEGLLGLGEGFGQGGEERADDGAEGGGGEGIGG